MDPILGMGITALRIQAGPDRALDVAGSSAKYVWLSCHGCGPEEPSLPLVPRGISPRQAGREKNKSRAAGHRPSLHRHQQAAPLKAEVPNYVRCGPQNRGTWLLDGPGAS